MVGSGPSAGRGGRCTTPAKRSRQAGRPRRDAAAFDNYLHALAGRDAHGKSGPWLGRPPPSPAPRRPGGTQACSFRRSDVATITRTDPDASRGLRRRRNAEDAVGWLARLGHPERAVLSHADAVAEAFAVDNDHRHRGAGRRARKDSDPTAIAASQQATAHRNSLAEIRHMSVTPASPRISEIQVSKGRGFVSVRRLARMPEPLDLPGWGALHLRSALVTPGLAVGHRGDRERGERMPRGYHQVVCFLPCSATRPMSASSASAPTPGGCAGCRPTWPGQGLDVVESYVSMTEINEYASIRRPSCSKPACTPTSRPMACGRSASTRCPNEGRDAATVHAFLSISERT